MRDLFRFPNPVNEVAARLVAAGVVVMAVALIATRWWWLLVLLTYGFIARVLAGPRLSPLALLVTRVVLPRSRIEPRPVPGPPKRFAQGIGAVVTVTASVLHVAFGADSAALLLIGMLAAFATLESVLGLCVGCKLFALLMRAGVIPESVCVECNDVTRRLQTSR